MDLECYTGLVLLKRMLTKRYSSVRGGCSSFCGQYVYLNVIKSQLLILMNVRVWSVIIFRCSPKDASRILIEFYDFLKEAEGVEDLHFIIRDRFRNQVVFSFRLLIEEKQREVINSNARFILRTRLKENMFAIDPNPEKTLFKFVEWFPLDEIKSRGIEKFKIFCSFLSQISRIVVYMAKKGNFSSGERVEMAHIALSMLGCTEYGILTTKEMQVRHYDRLDNRYHPYLRSDLFQTN